MIGYETEKPIPRTSRRRPAAAFWLLARNENGRMEMLMVGHGGGHVLPVFSGEGEAEMFVWLGGVFEGGWRIRETSAGELISIICGPCACATSVALDPSPDMTPEEMVGLVGISPARFLRRFATPGQRTPAHALR
jgi:hypothetical protein